METDFRLARESCRVYIRVYIVDGGNASRATTEKSERLFALAARVYVCIICRGGTGGTFVSLRFRQLRELEAAAYSRSRRSLSYARRAARGKFRRVASIISPAYSSCLNSISASAWPIALLTSPNVPRESRNNAVDDGTAKLNKINSRVDVIDEYLNIRVGNSFVVFVLEFRSHEGRCGESSAIVGFVDPTLSSTPVIIRF